MWQFINIQKEVTSLSQTTEHNWACPVKNLNTTAIYYSQNVNTNSGHVLWWTDKYWMNEI